MNSEIIYDELLLSYSLLLIHINFGSILTNNRNGLIYKAAGFPGELRARNQYPLKQFYNPNHKPGQRACACIISNLSELKSRKIDQAHT